MNGNILKPVTVSCDGKAPNRHTFKALKPISSLASRRAVVSRLLSSSSNLPPGKEIWPE